MTIPRHCPRCAWRLTQLEGVTGRISVCRRCGWSQVVLSAAGKSQGSSSTAGTPAPSLRGH
jgi:hypothetical protein